MLYANARKVALLDQNQSADIFTRCYAAIIDKRRFPWTQDLRLLLWETMEMFMEILAVKQEFRLVDETLPPLPTESKTRKDAYQLVWILFFVMKRISIFCSKNGGPSY